MTSIVICVPTYKAPYVVGEFKNKNEFATLSKKITEGHDGVRLQPYPARLIVHPMFCEENAYWRHADAIVKSKKATYFADHEGSLKFVANAGLISSIQEGGCPHPFGEVFLTIKKKDLPMKAEELQTEEQYEKSLNHEEEEEEEEEEDEKEEEDDNWLDVYDKPHSFEPYCGDHEHLQPYKNFTYYNCWGGGPEGGYITNDKDETYEVDRTWGTPFTVEPVKGKIDVHETAETARNSWTMRIRIVQ